MLDTANGWQEVKDTARLRVDRSRESAEVLKVIHDAGLHIPAVPVSGTIGPELVVGRKVYFGLGEIKSFVRRFTQTSLP